MMSWKPSRKIYTSYKKICGSANVNPVDFANFDKVFDKQRRVLSYMAKLGRKNPYIVLKLDDNFDMYAGFHDEKIIVNIWDKKETDAFLGMKRKE